MTVNPTLSASLKAIGNVMVEAHDPWWIAAVALANKNARMIWAMMASGERYREPQAA